jgi:hypothetical protein
MSRTYKALLLRLVKTSPRLKIGIGTFAGPGLVLGLLRRRLLAVVGQGQQLK